LVSSFEMTSHKIAGIVATVGLGYSLWIAQEGWRCVIPQAGPWPQIKIVEAIILVCWTLVPPIWFWFEYFFIYKPPRDSAPRPDFDSFKYAQDISAKIWISAVSALLILYFGKDLRH